MKGNSDKCKAIPKAWWDGTVEPSQVPVTAVFAIFEDRIPKWSGLYDASGVPLYRMPNTVPFGFQGRPKP